MAAVALFWASTAVCQTPDDDVPPRSGRTTEPTGRTPSPSGAAVEESPLETYYLKDSNGKLVPFFEALPFEEFERLYRLYQELEASQEPRRYSIQSLSVSGAADDSEAKLAVTINVRILRDGWARVPLRMNRLVLLDAPAHTGEGKQFIDFDPEGEGYVCWMDAAADTEHEIKFDGLVPLEPSAGATQFALRLPQATTSELRLTVPAANVEATPPVGANLRPVERIDDSHSRITVLGVGGEFQLAWRTRRPEQAAVAPVLEADATIRASFEGSRHVASDARLRVRNYSGPLESFVVRLPEGMELAVSDQALNQDRYLLSVRSEDDEDDESDDASRGEPGKTRASGQLIEVRLRRKTTEPLEINLRARLAGGANQPGEAVELAGFEVLGAERQWGHIDVAVEGDVQLVPHAVEGVHRVGGFVDPRGQGNVVARYEYDRQPCSLQVRLVPRETRVIIEPSYQLKVERDRVQLEARLQYRMSGSRSFELNVNRMGWEIDSVTPETLYPTASADGNESPLIVVLTPPAQSSAGQAEVRITAHQPLDGSADKLVLPLPRLEGGTVTPGRVVVLAADNIELAPLSAEMQGLAVETASVAIEGPARQYPPLVYRQLGGQEPTVFASRRTVRQREVAASVATALAVDAQGVQVEQRVSYRVAYEPLAQLELKVPRELVGLKGLIATIGDKEVNLVVADSPSDPSAAAEGANAPSTTAVGRVELPGGRIGSFELVVRYRLTLAALPPQKETRVNVPLLMPVENAETSLAGNTLSLTAAEALEATAPGKPWTTADDVGTGPRLGGFRVTASQAVTAVSIALRLVKADDRAATIVRQAWVQTWFAASDRRDRAVFRLATRGDRVQIQLPPGASSEPGDVDVRLDGKAMNGVAIDTAGQITLDLPTATPLAGNEHVVELWYSFRDGRPAVGTFEVGLPQMTGAHGPQQFYWQLALPADELLVRGPQGLADDLTWHWQQLFWTRRARLDQRELEQWIDSGHMAALPDSTNQYLFSGFGSTPSVAVTTAERRSLVLMISAATLVLGLALVHLRIARHPAVLTAAGVALAAVALLYPTLAIQAAQPAALALVFLAVVALVSWGVGLRRGRAAVVRGSTYATLDASSTQSALLRPSGGTTASGGSRVVAASNSLP